MTFLQPLAMIQRHRKALILMTVSDLKQKYAGSVLGPAWLFLYPLLFLALYSGIYLFVFRVRIPEFSQWSYVLTVFAGLVPYLGFSDTLQQGSQSLITHRACLKNTFFPPELLPVKTAWCAQAAHALSVAILTLMAALSGQSGQKLWLVPAVFFAHYLMLQGLVWMLSGLAMVVKDVQPALNLFLILVLFVSPVAFVPDMAPEAVRPFLALNPLYHAIALYRGAMFEAFAFDAGRLAGFYAAGLAVFFAGFRFFDRSKEEFLEYA